MWTLRVRMVSVSDGLDKASRVMTTSSPSPSLYLRTATMRMRMSAVMAVGRAVDGGSAAGYLRVRPIRHADLSPPPAPIFASALRSCTRPTVQSVSQPIHACSKPPLKARKRNGERGEGGREGWRDVLPLLLDIPLLRALHPFRHVLHLHLKVLQLLIDVVPPFRRAP